MISWHEDLKTGIAAIDAQHLGLVNTYNELYSTLTAGLPGALLEPVFLRLIESADRHFDFEEHLMRRHDYPDLEGHAVEHANLRRVVEKIRADVSEGQRSIGIDLMAFLKDWLMSHILDTDRPLGEFLERRGVT